MANDIVASLDNNKLEAFRNLNLLEQHRIDSFKDWPFPEQSTCSISKMAEAGFYWTGTKRENDTATCFVCGKTLDGWESEDDPWSEHRKHAPQCEFVKMGTAEKDLSISQFLLILGTVVKGNIQKSCKTFKQKFIRDNEDRKEEFVHPLK
ncbi:baculoviral IAP repeat-containing protein 5 [Drosophila bipectinata]|uniref:baculoviral IAP repeat-containing protein 5 n=1 Tax=Drosophila bipectinata TaxID=42026 RepID=UPI001C8AB8A6|nr:baculoviral IAP repeat-containing protein 5 [Drosophila bipectinata]